MQKTIFGVLGIVFGLTLSTLAVANALGQSTPSLPIGATQSHIVGVITEVEKSSVTIQGKQRVTGHVGDKTVILIDGRRAKATDLKHGENAKAELGLDDFWSSIVASTK